jgi:Arc/MetJ-type ribon-helix-helix transcriptional regulator
MMTDNDEKNAEKGPISEAGVEFRATIRFPQKDYEFLQRLIKEGEYTNITEIVRDAVKRFRLDWGDMETMKRCMPMGPMMGMRMPRMNMMMGHMQGEEPKNNPRQRDKQG